MEKSTRSYPQARLSPAKDGIIAIEFNHRSVMACDIAWALARLSEMSATRVDFERCEGRLNFFFAGWDQDPREVSQIPEIRAFFAALTEPWPYWFPFIDKTGDMLSVVLTLITPVRRSKTADGRVIWELDNTQHAMVALRRLFGAQNRLLATLGIPEVTNIRISQEVAQLIDQAIAP